MQISLNYWEIQISKAYFRYRFATVPDKIVKAKT